MTKAPKIKDSQRDMLLAVGFGAATHYGPDHRNEDSFAIFSGFYRGPMTRIVPKVVSPTQTGRSLLRLGWIKPYEGAVGGHRDAELSDAGRTIFETLLDDGMRAVLAEQAVHDEDERKREKTRKRREAWHRQHDETLRVLRQAMNERSYARNSLQHEMTSVAMKIGRGANDVDGLVERLREIVRKLDDLERLDAEAKAIWPEFKENEQ